MNKDGVFVTKKEITVSPDGKKVYFQNKPKNKFEELLWIWEHVFNKFSFVNQMVGKICFFVFVSQYFQQNIQVKYASEIRQIQISSLIFRPSRSGKGQALKVVRLFCEASGIPYEQSNELTSASLVGSFDYDMYATLLKAKHGDVSEEEQEEIKNQCRINGILSGNSGILSFPEIHDILYDIKAVNHLQTATDSPSFVDKDLKAANIHYQVNKSIIGTSIYLDELKDIILKKGLIQRMLIHMSNVPEIERNEINKKIINSFWESTTTDDINKYVSYFVQEIEGIKYRTGNKVLIVKKSQEKKIQSFLMNKLTNITNYVKQNYTGEAYKLATTWSTSVLDLIMKCASVSAILNEHTEIDYWDFYDTINIPIHNILSVLNYMFPKVFKTEQKSKKYKILKLLENESIGIAKSDLFAMLKSRKIITSPNKFVSIIKQLEDDNYITITKRTKGIGRPKEFITLCSAV